MTTSGIYSLTVTYGCNEYDTSIEVTVFNPDPVDIGPPTLTMCPGDSYSISLDDQLGTFEWRDGSTGGDFTITETGLYSITMDDGCDISFLILHVFNMI